MMQHCKEGFFGWMQNINAGIGSCIRIRLTVMYFKVSWMESVKFVTGIPIQHHEEAFVSNHCNFSGWMLEGLKQGEYQFLTNKENINSEHMWKHLQPATDINRSNSLQEVHNIQSLPKSRREDCNRQNLHFDWCHYQHRLQESNSPRWNTTKLQKEQQKRCQRLLTVNVRQGVLGNAFI